MNPEYDSSLSKFVSSAKGISNVQFYEAQARSEEGDSQDWSD